MRSRHLCGKVYISLKLSWYYKKVFVQNQLLSLRETLFWHNEMRAMLWKSGRWWGSHRRPVTSCDEEVWEFDVKCSNFREMVGLVKPKANSLDPDLLPFFRIQNELADLDEVLVRGSHRVVIPLVLWPMTRTQVWLELNKDSESSVGGLVWTPCSQHDNTTTTWTALLQPVLLPNAASEKLAMDIVGPFNSAPPDCCLPSFWRIITAF